MQQLEIFPLSANYRITRQGSRCIITKALHFYAVSGISTSVYIDSMYIDKLGECMEQVLAQLPEALKLLEGEDERDVIDK